MRPSHCLRISLKIKNMPCVRLLNGPFNELREKLGVRNSERLWGVMLSVKLMAWGSGRGPSVVWPFSAI